MSVALRMPRTRLEDLADATGIRLPWRAPRPVATGAGVPPPLAAALEAFGSAVVLVDVDLVVRRAVSPGGPGGTGVEGGLARLRSWQRLAGDRVVTISAAGAETVELAWLGVAGWHDRLAHTVTVEPPPAGTPPPADLGVPHELLVGGCAALRAGRPDLVELLLSRHAGQVSGAAATTALVRRLAGSSGRMRATVVARGRRGDRRIGWLSWMLFADGWHALTPCSRDGVPTVRIRAVRAGDLGGRVARLVLGARA